MDDDKLPIYQWLVALVPGSALLFVVYVLLWHFGYSPRLLPIENEAVQTFAFLLAGLIVGEILQTISSLGEGLLIKTWGGRPSIKITQEEKYDGHFAILKVHFGDHLSREELFEHAMTLCNNRSLGRSEYFNVLYGYVRSLFFGSIIVFLFSISLMIYVKDFSVPSIFILVSEVIVSILFWMRTKKRGQYFAKEIVTQAFLSLKLK